MSKHDMSKFVTTSPTPSRPPVRGTLVFDLDGTLVDSIPDLLASANRVLAGLGLAPLTAPEIMPMVGDGIGVLVRRVMAARGIEANPAHRQAFVDDYTAHVADNTRPYSGIPETLGFLAKAGWRLAVCTNKLAAPTRELLARLGLLPHFDAIGAGDSYPARKPDPVHLLATLRDAGGDPADSIMVGDHHNDLAAAQGANMPSIFAGWGYGQNTGATAVANTVVELPSVIDQILPRRTSNRPDGTARP